MSQLNSLLGLSSPTSLVPAVVCSIRSIYLCLQLLSNHLELLFSQQTLLFLLFLAFHFPATQMCSQPTLLTSHLLHCVSVSDGGDVELQPLGDQGPALPGQHSSLQKALGPADVGGGAAHTGHGAPGVRPGPGLTKLLTPLPTSLP